MTFTLYKISFHEHILHIDIAFIGPDYKFSKAQTVK